MEITERTHHDLPAQLGAHDPNETNNEEDEEGKPEEEEFELFEEFHELLNLHG